MKRFLTILIILSMLASYACAPIPDEHTESPVQTDPVIRSTEVLPSVEPSGEIPSETEQETIPVPVTEPVSEPDSVTEKQTEKAPETKPTEQPTKKQEEAKYPYATMANRLETRIWATA